MSGNPQQGQQAHYDDGYGQNPPHPQQGNNTDSYYQDEQNQGYYDNNGGYGDNQQQPAGQHQQGGDGYYDESYVGQLLRIVFVSNMCVVVTTMPTRAIHINRKEVTTKAENVMTNTRTNIIMINTMTKELLLPVSKFLAEEEIPRRTPRPSVISP